MAEDFLRLAADIAAARARSETLTSQVVRKVAADVETNAKAIAPVDTGNLRASIGTEMRGRYEAEVGPSAAYGIYVEFGTSRMAPQAFMGPSLDRYSGTFVEAMGKVGEL